MTAMLEAYEGLQKALDENPQDQTLRLILADWYEEQGRPWAAECMRWLAEKGHYPLYYRQWKTYQWGWAMGGISKPWKQYTLPAAIWHRLPSANGYQSYYRHQIWWSLAGKIRQEAEEAAVLAWEEFRQKHPEEPLC